jgi:pimeloyl-ACP methyl ester carboxylesterase
MNKHTLPILAFLAIQSVGCPTVSAQSMLELYFGGNKDIMMAEATRLIHLPDPSFNPSIQPSAPDSATIADMGFEQVYSFETREFIARDNKRLFAYRYPSESNHTIILIHGTASSAYVYNRTAGLLRDATQADVYAIDLRGHGQSEGIPGDVDHIDQYAHDLADIMAVIRKEKPDGNIIIAGHSMGGGIALRYAMDQSLDQPDGFLLFAPLIGHNSPAFPAPDPTATTTEEPFLKIHIERIIGLKMLTELGNHEHDSLRVLFFNLPDAVPLRSYSYRANSSMAPDDYVVGLNAVNKPMMVLIGRNDEAFSAVALQKAILENSKADVFMIDHASHNGVRHHPQSFKKIHDWFLTF